MDSSLRVSATNAAVPQRLTQKTICNRLYFFGKLVQSIIWVPPVATVTFAGRFAKLLTWVPLKAGVYKVSGYHSESSAYLEGAYLDTVKAVRDLLFIPSVVKRAFLDMVAKRESYVDDLPKMPAETYLNVPCTKSFPQFSSSLHGCATFEVSKPEGITEFAASSDAALQTVMASHIFKPGIMAINFGTPNVATFVTEAQENGSVQTVKVDAKSLYREPMAYHGTNGKIQSGIFFVPLNLPPEALDRFKKAAQGMVGSKHITCVNTNCRILKEAGFTIEGVAMDGVVFPNTLMEHLLFRNVFYTDVKGIKHKVHFDILNTTQHNLEQFCEEVDTAVVGTRFRHHRRNADSDENRKARGEAAQAFIRDEVARLALASNEPERKRDNEDLSQRKVTISVPTFFGDAIARIWGRHTIYEVDLNDRKKEIADAFEVLAAKKGGEGVKLRPFPQEKPNLSTRLKRDFFFSGPMIRLLRRHMMGRVDEIHLCAQGIFQHLKSTKGARLNYVLLDDKVVLARVQANGNAKEAHKKVADWALSKHALLSGRQDVYCSGEMWYDEATDRYMMNHDSGTYKPSPEHVKVAAQLANKFFGNSFEAVQVNEGVEAAA